MNNETSPISTSNQLVEKPSGRQLFTSRHQLSFIKDQTQSDMLDRLMSLEGECKIQTYEFLRFNLVKCVFLIVPIVASLFGLFALKYSIRFRACVFYDSVKADEATHIFVKGNEKTEEIVIIQNINPIKFSYKKLRYIEENGRAIPGGFRYEKFYDTIFGEKHKMAGLSQKQADRSFEFYGRNQHTVDIPTFFEYMVDMLTTPFFLLQYIFCIIFVIQSYLPFSIALLFFSFTAATINYIMLYISYNKIKEMAEKTIYVNVLRDGKMREIQAVNLVPGDVFEPKEEIPCDALMLKGDVYVNEANLTGESYPIGKFPVNNFSSIAQNNRWLFEGSTVLEARVGTLALVINVGYQTHRGRIIRRILTRQRKQPDIFRSALIFVLEVTIISVISFFACLPLILNLDIEPLFIVFEFFHFLASAAPPPLPIFFHVAYSFSLTRLKFKEISGTEPQKTVDGAYLKIMCFDKTGTLTQTQVQVQQIFKVQEQALHSITQTIQQRENTFVNKIFSSCHTVKIINDELLGDEIDQQIWKVSQYTMARMSDDDDVKFVVRGPDGEKLQILRINQFQSQFQSMSVLVRDAREDKYYVFVKGAPEKLKRQSINHIHEYDKMISRLSLSGLRTIAFGWKEVKPNNVQEYFQMEREEFDKNIYILGVIGFQNKLKKDAKETIQRLFESNINSKIITGDNIFIAIETATRAGILEPEEPVIILEGRTVFRNSNFQEKQIGARKFRGIILKRSQGQVQEEPIELKEDQSYLTQPIKIAVDGDFMKMPGIEMSEKIVLFARIPPEGKAKIIAKYKFNILKKLQETNSGCQNFLKSNRLKVGMCGDGANDLLALRQADVSLGIQQSDASYGSSFTIKNLLAVDQVVRESKCTLENIIQLFQYHNASGLFNLVCSVLLISDATFFSVQTLMFMNFTSLLLYPGMIAMSRPADKPSPYTPDANFMGLHNHLIFWGNVVIPSGGAVAAFLFYTQTDEFEPNPRPSITVQESFYSKTHSATMMFLILAIIYSTNVFVVYRSYPWKQRIYKNIFLLALIIINLAVIITFHFFTEVLVDPLSIVQISKQNAGIILQITGASVLVSFIFNSVVNCCKIDHKLLE